MVQLKPVQIDENTTIYIETEEEAAPVGTSFAGPMGGDLTAKSGAMEKAMGQMKALENAISTYTQHSLDAFKAVTTANVDKVKLEFGISVSGEAGIPYITKGEVGSNLKITVECSFPDKSK